MAFIRCCILTAAILSVFCNGTGAQTLYYPVQSSSMLKSTAADAADLFKKAIPSAAFSVQPYTSVPATGIVFVYDSSITGNQACRIESNGTTYIKFSAAEDNGLCFGVYQYLQQLGFRFYQPGSVWEVIPSLASPYKNISTTVNCSYKYKTWYISGGHNRWAMDNNTAYGWDTYYGDNGHQWALYQRRNGMMGAYRFSGHRGDILSGSFYSALQNNPCYVACYNGSRQATTQSVPDIFSSNATQMWAGAIEQKFTQFKNTIYGNSTIYTDYYRNFNFNYSHIGIEGPDGAQWGNSGDNSVCGSQAYPKESDQQFILAGKTAEKVNSIYPAAKLQCYAYSSHADVPSAGISIGNNIDVQVIPTAFQNETSPKGLLNRWYNKHANISEYHYLNIPQWGGETPMFSLNDMKTTLQRLQKKNSQGIVWEASPAKFASLPFLLAANNKLVNNIEVDSTLKDFCDAMFADASPTIYKLLQFWGDEKLITTSDFIPDNKYKLPLYFKLLNTAVIQTQNTSAQVKQRLNELKVYLHYMKLYYDWYFDQRSNEAKKDKAAALCLYLAKINRLQVVNSYFLIADITSRYAATDNFNVLYNVASGTAYQNGNLALISSDIIESNFTEDVNTTGSLIQQYEFRDAPFVKAQMPAAKLNSLRSISVSISYTNGYNYPGRCEYYIDAPAAGSFKIDYKPRFDMPGKGNINFTVEAVDNALDILADLSLTNGSSAGTLKVDLPVAGRYKLSVVSKNKSAVDLVITSNGNQFYKNTAFLGNKIENYRGNLASLPAYFYVPQGIDKVFFSVNNGNPGGAGFVSAVDLGKTFLFRDNNGNEIIPVVSGATEQALFYLPVPAGTSGAFFKVNKMEQYNCCFANISNLLWYAEKDYCSNNGFTVSLTSKKDECITKVSTTADKSGLQWTIVDAGKTLNYNDVNAIDLPANISPAAVITLKDANNCTITKTLRDEKNYLRDKESCASAAPLANAHAVSFAPNPSTGIFNCVSTQKGFTKADEIVILSSQGNKVLSVKNASQVNISGLASGVYFYQCTSNGQLFKGRLVKL